MAEQRLSQGCGEGEPHETSIGRLNHLQRQHVIRNGTTAPPPAPLPPDVALRETRNGAVTLENRSAVSLSVKHKFTICRKDPAISLRSISTQEKWKRVLTKDFEVNARSSIIHNSRKLETARMSISRWRDKGNVACPYDGTRVSNKKKRNSDICYGMEEPQKQYAKWEMLDAKDHIAHDRIWSSRKAKSMSYSTGHGYSELEMGMAHKRAREIFLG